MDKELDQGEGERQEQAEHPKTTNRTAQQKRLQESIPVNTSLSFFTVFATLLITLPGYDEHRGLAHS